MGRRLPSLHEQLVQRAVSYANRRGGALLRRGGRADGGLAARGGSGAGPWADRFDPTKIYAIGAFSAANYYATLTGGGEAGVSTGFGTVELLIFDTLGVVRWLVSRANVSGTAGHLLWIDAANDLQFIAGNGSAIGSNKVRILPSDLGKILLVVGWHTGAQVRLGVSRVLGTGNAIAGFTPIALPTAISGVSQSLGASPAVGVRHLANFSFRGAPSDTQIEALFDATRVLGDVPALFPLTSASDADIDALAPPHWYRTDDYTLSGSNLSTLPNRGTAGGQLSVSVGTVAEPAAEPALLNALAMELTGTQALQASHPPSTFRYRHNGSGRHEFVVVIPSTTAPILQGILSTRASSGFGVGSTLYLATTSLSHVIGNGSANIFTPAPTQALSAIAAAQPYLLEVSYQEGLSVEATLARNGIVLASGASGGAPALATDPDATLFLGGFSDGSRFSGKIADVLSFDRVLSPAQRQRVLDYVRTRYGIGVVTTTHRWSLRDVLAAANVPVIDGQTAPAQLPDTITAALIDRMDRQGSPIVDVIDPSVDGRKSYGALGFSSLNLLQNAAGIRGGATFSAAWFGRIDLQDGTNRTMMSCRVASEGWRVTQNNANTALWVYDGAAALNITGGPVLPVGVPVAVVATWSAGVGRTFVCTPAGVVETVGTPGTAGYTPSAEPFRIGDSGAVGDEGINQSWFGSTGSDSAAVNLAQVTAWWASVQQSGRIQALPGAQHTWDPTTDILANGGPTSGVPMTVLDRIGTDHLSRVGGLRVESDLHVEGFDSGHWFQTSGIAAPGSASGFYAEVLYDHPSTIGGFETLFQCATYSAGLGWVLANYNGTPRAFFCGNVVGIGFAVPAAGRHHLALTFDGTTWRLYFDGVVSPTTANTAFSASTAAAAFGVNRYSDGAGAALNSGVYGGAYGTSVPTAGEIATAAAAALSTGKIVGVPGKFTKLWSIVDDVIDADGEVPVFVRERVAGVDNMAAVGSPLQVAQRAERVWSYETSPLLYGATAFESAVYYASPTGGAGNALAFGGTLVWTPTVGASATRVLLTSLNGGTARGWEIRTTGTNALLSMQLVDASNTIRASSSTAITALLGKLCVFTFQWDGVSNRLRVYLNRAEIGSGTAITGYAPSTGTVLAGRETTGVSAPATNSELYGFTLWEGIAVLAQVQAQHDAIMVADGRIQEMPNVTTTMLVDMTADALANSGALPAVLEDRAGANDMTRTGIPATAPRYARAFGW